MLSVNPVNHHQVNTYAPKASIPINFGSKDALGDTFTQVEEKTVDKSNNGKFDFSEKITVEDRKNIIKLFLDRYNYEDDKQTWFDKIKVICDNTGFASNNKDYKANPENYKGNISDVSNVIRVALTGRQMSPDMYEIMQVMGKEATIKRLNMSL